MRLAIQIRLLKLGVLVLALFAAQAACAQETVFDVPSPDVLEQGKVYGELDGTARPVNPTYTSEPASGEHRFVDGKVAAVE